MNNNKTNNNIDYNTYIYSETEFNIGKLNLQYISNSTNKIVVLDNLDESNFINIIKLILINKFKFSDLQLNSINLLICNKFIKFNNLKYSDLDRIKYGDIYKIVLST